MLVKQKPKGVNSIVSIFCSPADAKWPLQLVRMRQYAYCYPKPSPEGYNIILLSVQRIIDKVSYRASALLERSPKVIGSDMV